MIYLKGVDLFTNNSTFVDYVGRIYLVAIET